MFWNNYVNEIVNIFNNKHLPQFLAIYTFVVIGWFVIYLIISLAFYINNKIKGWK
jgi:tryptophan-rich sensory protein